MDINITKQDRKEIRKIMDRFKSNMDYDREIFYNMCFCLCSPQTTFKSNMDVIQSLKLMGFYLYDFPMDIMIKAVTPVRFKKNKARYLIEAKKLFPQLILPTLKTDIDNKFKRQVLVDKVNGFGLKTASHFLRNCGISDLAIIDTHILKFLNKEHLKGKVPAKEYVKMEKDLTCIASDFELSVAEFDIWLWKTYSNTRWEDYVY